MKLSVAMVTYNHEKYIGQAIESILAQKVNFEYEIVIGEDCSTDGTRAVVREFQRRYPDRIRLLFRDHNVGANRNFAESIEACQGEYLAILDGDDYWMATDKLQKQIDFLDAHPECAICCGRARPLHADTQDFDTKWNDLPSCPAGTYAVEDILKANFVMPCTAVLRRCLIGPFPKWFFEMKLGDWPLCAMVARYGEIELMDGVMAAYRVHQGGVWSSMPQDTRSEESLRMLKALNKELQYAYSDTIREVIASMHLSLISISRSNGRRKETAKHFLNYIRDGGWRRLGTARVIVGIVAYEIVGAWRKVLSRTNSANRS
jgi:glycosyltransferase involved in cell wall biosynthesis